MMPLWLDLLRTPMAAPETRILKAMRFVWQGLCLTLAASLFWFANFRQVAGQAATSFVAGLMLLTSLHTLLYLRAKHRADEAYLALAGEEK